MKAFLARIQHEVFEDAIAARMAVFLKSKSEKILELVRHSEYLASVLEKQALDYVLCHADIHGWNLLISKEGELFVVDWDTLIYAPKERDLMFIGAGIGHTGRTVPEEESYFIRGMVQRTSIRMPLLTIVLNVLFRILVNIVNIFFYLMKTTKTGCSRLNTCKLIFYRMAQ